MTVRFWHLVRSEARAHRGVLGLWLLLLAWVATGSITKIWIQKNLTWHEQRRFEGTFLDSLLIWNSNNIGSMDVWLWQIAGLVAAWVWLTDPLQSPGAFWATRPVRLPELMMARALVCLVVLVLIPAALGVCASLVGGFSPRDTWLSAISFGLVKAGMVPLGFLAGIFWPAPGRRWMALLPALGWWLGLVCWHSPYVHEADFADYSLTSILLWLGAPIALVILVRFRRGLLPQSVFAVAAFALVWMTSALRQHFEEPGWQSAQSVGLPTLRITATPKNFEVVSAKSADPRMAVKLKLHAEGLPPDAAAMVIATQLVMTPGTSKPPEWPEWQSRTLILDSLYGALAHAMNLRPENFPREWYNEERAETVTLPAPTFDNWKDDQTVTVTGKVRLRLMRLREHWQGTYHKSLSEWPGGIHLQGAVAEIANNGNGVLWIRPWLADFISRGDTSKPGILFNPQLTFWILAFQPPQKLPNGAFTRNITRTPPLWAIGKYQGPSYYTSHEGGWTDIDSSTTRIESKKPELVEITRDGSGLNGLPAALISATEFAELEVPLEPLTLTKRQILETRKVSPVRP